MPSQQKIDELVAKAGKNNGKEPLHKNEVSTLQATARVTGSHGREARDALKKRGLGW